MFNVGFTELIVLAVIGLIVIGPEQLPEMAKKLAKILNDLKRAKDEIMSPVDDLKNEALRAVEKVREETERTRKETEQKLNIELVHAIDNITKAKPKQEPPSTPPPPDHPSIEDKKDSSDG